MTRPARDRGNAVVQFPLMAIVIVGFMAALMLIGRVNTSHAAAESAARYSARTLSLARDPNAAISVARDEAEDTVALGSARCETLDFDPVITPENVTVTLTCTVDLSDVGLIGMPGQWTVTASATEPIDPFREGAP